MRLHILPVEEAENIVSSFNFGFMTNRIRQKWRSASGEPRSKGFAGFFLSLFTSAIAVGRIGEGQPAGPRKRMRDMQSISEPIKSLPLAHSRSDSL